MTDILIINTELKARRTALYLVNYAEIEIFLSMALIDFDNLDLGPVVKN